MGLQLFDMADTTEVTVPFPAPKSQATAQINGIETEIVSISFLDKIMITITQNGRLAQWVCILFFSLTNVYTIPSFSWSLIRANNFRRFQYHCLQTTLRPWILTSI